MKTDKDLNLSLVHEFFRCKSAFDMYIFAHGKLLKKKGDVILAISCYNSYIDFVSHLYEFYIAHIKRNGFYPTEKDRKKRAEAIDSIFNFQVERILIVKREMIEKGFLPALEKSLPRYQVQVPVEFGSEFRQVRNLRSHVGSDRAKYDLGAFYQKYHGFVYLLYEEPQWLWNVDPSKGLGLEQITKFSAAIGGT